MSCAIACDLGALAPAERTRRAELAEQLLARAERVEEIADGFALRFGTRAGCERVALEWTLLERRCCPFLRFALRLDPGAGDARATHLTIELGGSAEAKAFLAATGLGARLTEAR